MSRRVVRHCVAVGLLLVATAMALRTPGIWHAHVGGDSAHRHSRQSHSPDSHEHAAHHAGHPHSHSHGTHRHAHHGHTHVHDGASHSHDSGHWHSSAGHSHETPEASVSAEPTWHMHVSLFGFEVTLSWPMPGRSNSHTAQNVDRARVVQRQRHRAAPAADVSHSASSPRRLAQAGPVRATLSLPVDRTAIRFLGIELGPVPCRVALDAAMHTVRLELAVLLRGGRDAQRPATPPPRAPAA